MNLTLMEIAAALGALPSIVDPRQNITGVSTDTRTLRPGELFVALAGEHFDGHQFCGAAVRRGAGGLVISAATLAQEYRARLPVLRVTDTLEALGAIARCWRKKCNPRVVALSGSCGKTTVKDMIAHVAARHFNLHFTKGNLNNRVGVPQTLFALQPEHTHALLEAGMNQPGELAALARIIDAEGVALTNVNQAHCGNFTSPDGVRAAKAELIRHSANAAWVALNADCENSKNIRQRDVNRAMQVLAFGENPAAEIGIRNIEPLAPFGSRFELIDRRGGAAQTSARCELRLFGRAHAHNAACAAAVLLQWGLDLQTIADGLRDFSPGELRSQVLQCGDKTIIADCYNSNPAALRNALHSLGEMPVGGRRVAILGDMLELGNETEKFHHECGCSANESKLDLLITVGNFSRLIAAEYQRTKFHFEKKETLIDELDALLQDQDTILIKGSRSLALEDIVDALRALYPAAK